jgi:Uma2 family endonuclease
MSTRSRRSTIDYPTRDGRPVGETDIHRDDHFDLVKTLQAYYADDATTYVSGNLLLFYEEGNRRKHVSPDVFVIFGVPKRRRDNYLIWEEGRAPDLVIELTSKTTHKEDLEKKYRLYRDTLQVREYILFDPKCDYLTPPLQGYRLVAGEYVPIEPVAGRLPSEVLGLHFERDGTELRIYNPATGLRLPTPGEAVAAAEAARRQAEAARDEAARELERLRRELDALRGRADGGAGPGPS